MPLLPAFEGEIGTGTGTAIQAITHWNYASICRGPGSLYQRLQKEGIIIWIFVLHRIPLVSLFKKSFYNRLQNSLCCIKTICIYPFLLVKNRSMLCKF